MTPVVRSTTGQGSIAASGTAFTTTCIGSHVFPPSTLRLSTLSVGLWSRLFSFRPSQKASSVPLVVRMTDGMRYE